MRTCSRARHHGGALTELTKALRSREEAFVGVSASIITSLTLDTGYCATCLWVRIRRAVRMPFLAFFDLRTLATSETTMACSCAACFSLRPRLLRSS
jgi:hypothetical protein